MTAPARQRRMVRVELVESERIAGRGRRTLIYRVRKNDAWIPVREHPGAIERALDAGPGVVWERLIELELPVGTGVERVESAPAPEASRDALAHLMSGQKSARRRSRRTELVVGPRGELVRPREKAQKTPLEPTPAGPTRRGR